MQPPSLTPEYRALLATIASTEAPAYNVMYGHGWSGQDRTFSDFSDHPRQYHEITSGPNKGKKSSAAGKYQFLASTWDSLASRYGLSDFSPPNQDLAAIAYAIETYGPSLQADLASNDPAKLAEVGRRLSSKWTSLPSGIEQGQSEDRFVSTFRKALANPSSNVAISQALSSASAAGSSMADALSSYASQTASTSLTDAPTTSPSIPAAQSPSRPNTQLPEPPPLTPLAPLRLTLDDPTPSTAAPDPRAAANLRAQHRALARSGDAPPSFSQWLRSQGF